MFGRIGGFTVSAVRQAPYSPDDRGHDEDAERHAEGLADGVTRGLVDDEPSEQEPGRTADGGRTESERYSHPITLSRPGADS
jgi:hypothetical protein